MHSDPISKQGTEIRRKRVLWQAMLGRKYLAKLSADNGQEVYKINTPSQIVLPFDEGVMVFFLSQLEKMTMELLVVQ